MGIKDLFKKKDEEVIDLADLQKRGIYKPKKVFEKDKNDVIDFSSPASRESASGESALGFLGNLANTNNLGEQGSEKIGDKKQVIKEVLNGIKSDAKQNSDRIYKLMERIDLLEKKLDRIERRVGL